MAQASRTERYVGLAGAILVAAAGYGVGALPGHTPFGQLPTPTRLADPAYAVGMAAWLVGVVLLVVAWLRLRRPAYEGVLSDRWMLVTVGLWALPMLLSAPLGSRDGYAYAAQGDLYAHGLDPYQVGPSALPSRWLGEMSPSWRDSPVPYGPLALLVTRVAAAPGNLTVALVVLRLAALAGVLLLAWHLPRLARACGVPAGAACWLGLGSPVLLVHLVSGAHNDALMLGLLVAGLAYAARRRGVPAGLALGLAAAVKITALVALPFAVVLLLPATRLLAAAGTSPGAGPATRVDADPETGRGPGPDARRGSAAGVGRLVRAAVAPFLAGAVGFAAVTLVSGLGFGWVSALSGTEASVQWTSLPTGVGMVLGFPLAVAGLPGAGGVLAVCRAVAFYAVLPVVLVALWWPLRHGAATRTVVARAGWALAALLLCSPTVHPWYVLWPVAVLAAAVTDQRVVRTLAVLLVVLTALVLPDGYNLARVTAPVGALADVAVVVALAVSAVRRWRGDARMRIVTPAVTVRNRAPGPDA
ncbi:MAG TPA: polyprenol phosphomannose-dependent alpha 1,6 mannosyltransferase MptB [Actinocatenispora sp.]